jgi:predicted  nucleic acid-binding Zn-ribbon protein
MPNTDIRKLLEELRADVDKRIGDTTAEIDELREMIRQNQISDEEAAERLDYLEKGFEDLRLEVKGVTKEIAKMNVLVSSFSPKLDRFFDNLWKVVFFLLAIVAGLVGIKLW